MIQYNNKIIKCYEISIDIDGISYKGLDLPSLTAVWCDPLQQFIWIQYQDIPSKKRIFYQSQIKFITSESEVIMIERLNKINKLDENNAN
jgi:hypothetical protein